jgi:hypothetical protein
VLSPSVANSQSLMSSQLPHPRAPMRSALRPLDRMRAVVLLGGALRPNPLLQAIGRSVLDLPLDASTTILSHWERHATDLALHLRAPSLPLRVMVDAKSPAPRSSRPSEPVAVTVERDPVELRGTGGLLRDLAEAYDDDDWLLVASAAQVLGEPLAVLTNELASGVGDVRLLSHSTGVPAGLMLVRCGCLRLIPAVGFVDMKEQALPRIAINHQVGVVERREPTGWPIGALDSYIQSVRRYHLRTASAGLQRNPFREDCRSTFAVVEEGAVVDESARLYDSVVLADGRVEAGAVLVRSVVCGGAVAPRKSVLVDQVVAPPYPDPDRSNGSWA